MDSSDGSRFGKRSAAAMLQQRLRPTLNSSSSSYQTIKSKCHEEGAQHLPTASTIDTRFLSSSAATATAAQDLEQECDNNNCATDVYSRQRRHLANRQCNQSEPALMLGKDEDRSGSDSNRKFSRIAEQNLDRLTQQGHRHRQDSNRLVCEVRSRLSLSLDVPSDLLVEHHEQLASIDDRLPISRKVRRQTLSAIGFGQLSTYAKLHVLGAGTYSIVYKGTSRLTNKLVALKEIHLEREEGVPFTAIREISLLKGLRHSNIITLHDIIYTNRVLVLVFEFVDRDLSRYMVECEHKIDINNVKLFLFQLLRGLKYCHDRRILHRDLKPQNILIGNNGELKLADFGLARAKSVPTKTFTDEVVTLWYRPPDVLLGNVEYGTSIDIWGVGCIFFEMAAGATLFTGLDPKKQVEIIFQTIGTPGELEWPTIKQDLRDYELEIPNYPGRNLKSILPRLEETGVDLLNKFLRCNPNLRISATESLHHPYFDSLTAAVHNLSDTESIFSLPNIRLAKELTIHSQHNVCV